MFNNIHFTLNYQVLILLILGVFYLIVHNAEKEKYILFWGSAWGLDLIRYAIEYAIEYGDLSNTFLTQVIVYGLLVTSSILFTYGFQSFFEVNFLQKGLWIISLSLGWYSVNKILGISNYIAVIPMYVFLGVVSIFAGTLIFKNFKVSKVISGLIIGILLVLIGIRECTYPIVKHFNLINYLVDFDLLYSLKITLAIVLLMHFYEIANSMLAIIFNKQEELMESLNREKEWLQTTLRSIGDGVIATDANGNIEFMNSTAERLIGYKEEEVLGKKIDEVFNIINEDTKEKAEVPIEKVLKTGNTTGLANHTALISKNGEIISIADSASPIKDSQGNIIGTVMVFRDISDKRKYEKLLKQYEFIVESSEEGIGTFDFNGIIQTWNKGCEKIYGYKAEEIIGNSIYMVIPDFEREKIRNILERLLKGEDVKSYEGIRVRKDGKLINVLVSIAALKDELGRYIGISFISHDITENKKAEQILRRYKLLFDDINDIILFAKYEDGKIIEVNKAAIKAYGYEMEELLKMDIFELCDCEKEELTQLLDVGDESGVLLNLQHKRKDGSKFYVEANVAKVEFENEKLIMMIIRDITERKLTQDRLEHLGTHDILTGLYNRNFFEEKMTFIEKNNVIPTGIIICDVDGLKLVNDTMGHKAGDMLLKTAADVLGKCFRGQDIIARIGGDEFAIILPNASIEVVEKAVDRIRKMVENSKFAFEKENIPLSMSIGYAVKNNSFKKIEEVFKEADNNMYREKLFHKRSSYRKVLDSILKMFEIRQPKLQKHLKAVKEILVNFAEYLKLSRVRIKNLELLAEFHDIGMIGISDKILDKVDNLNEEEKLEFQKHCEIGYRIAMSSPDLAHLADMILMHHEWWNGQGYPLAVKGEDIPYECRILAIVDAYVQMIDKEWKGLSKEQALKEIEKMAGIQFDPILVEKFLAFMKD
ncbi:PAS domain S-box-containing protein/diguanylate cyclase (GGDEF) domain-containing protein [Thermoanaerobacter uzonensis DSM 18761]|uniref:PAS domain S-box-containing protein/diguanylate cyclase (GGDEF) domain-containing protein n=1 Tax=Thermoanaerobacter uzonensis DSM 18761 TaxID=1123369 RepID=A0A1M5A721_9THEO|nr:PAS domain S-box protein [Thermoanaerobacter uzonensis]SHF26101.1 PAS domain S-box-containing protein/diguanylate cyclase (GGDEF) domain-containing protein [Thermoanaerobacter uzonensis DSM 18761]